MYVKRRRIAKWISFLLVVSLVFSSGYHTLAGFSELKSYPPPGELIDVGGYRLHIYCIGEGEPTVVMESGLSGWSTDWILVQLEVAKITRACTYDRAGYGWSEVGPRPRDSRQAAAELETLLSKSGIDGDIVLVGHSLGGLFVQYYTKLHSEQVAGIVLVDSVHPEQSLTMRESVRKKYEGDLKALTLMSRILAPTGLLRLSGQSVTSISNKLPIEYQTVARSLGFQSKAYRAMDEEMAAFQQSQSEVREAGPLPEIPMVVISSSLVKDFPPGFSAEIKSTWDEMQADLSKAATMPQVIATASGHYIHIDQPELVIEMIQEMVTTVHGK